MNLRRGPETPAANTAPAGKDHVDNAGQVPYDGTGGSSAGRHQSGRCRVDRRSVIEGASPNF